jgi:nitrogenase molybdenum-iron protein NifN
MVWKETEYTVRMVNENQCQMCMPLGGVIAFKGIENAMVISHGSQGCSTYMRLASVEHFNEPVDIASSGLNEKQTIHGGESNLKKAIDNVLRVYQPQVLGVFTTCLSETMGEDLDRIVTTYKKERNLKNVEIIPVPTPSYSGSHPEGFWAAIRALIVHLAKPTEKHSAINIIVPHISPADLREIKRILGLMRIEYTLIPDYSITLDRPYGGKYQKIPPGGTRTEAIEKMSGAPLTIQFGLTCPDIFSPGKFLEEQFGVPLINLPLPIGVEATDEFINTLRGLTSGPVPDQLALERGWLLDAMADSHKYNSEGRPVIYGEPEWVYALTRVCSENGAPPVVIASATRNSKLSQLLVTVFPEEDEKPILLEDTDFAAIETAAASVGVNIAVGHSGGKFLTERRAIPVVRIGFPIHDRIGGQRILSVGYAGTLAFLDRFTNTLLEAKYASYRTQIRERMTLKEGC